MSGDPRGAAGTRWPVPDRRTVARAVLRVLIAAAIYWSKRLPVVPDVLAVVGAIVAMVFAVKVLIDWIRTVEWDHDAKLIREGNERANLRRAEARETSRAIREQKRLAKERRRRSA